MPQLWELPKLSGNTVPYGDAPGYSANNGVVSDVQIRSPLRQSTAFGVLPTESVFCGPLFLVLQVPYGLDYCAMTFWGFTSVIR